MVGKILVGMLGQSAENISRGESGLCWFPLGPEDPRFTYGFKWVKVRVKAIEDVVLYREVIVVDGDRRTIKEHTPVEVKVLGYVYDDYMVQAYAGIEAKYVIGTAAYTTDRLLPDSFISEHMFLTPTTNCLVRFGANTQVQHLLLAGVQWFYPRRCKEIFIVQQLAPGTLTVRAFGNEVGV